MRKTTRAHVGLVFGVCATIFGAAACGDDDNALNPTAPDGGGIDSGNDEGRDSGAPEDSGPQEITVTLRFKAKVGASDFACGQTYAGLGTGATEVTPRDLKFYVSDLALLDAQGNATTVAIDERTPWQASGVALLDFEDATGGCAGGTAEKNTQITGKVKAGAYTGVSFSNAVPLAMNHADPTTAPAPLQTASMLWSWLGGYRFIVAEMAQPAPAMGIGLFHLGSTGCTNAGSIPGQPPDVACTAQNRNAVKLTGFDPEAKSIVLDVGAVFAATDLSTMSLCHGMGAACPSMLTSVGVAANGAPMQSQSAFRVE